MIRDRHQKQDRQSAEKGRILARPTQINEAALGGLQPLGLGTGRDGLLYVPASYQASQPAPLVLILHGAGGNAHQALALFQHLADASGLVILAPDSRDRTWDIILGGYGSDIGFIDSALEQTFSRYAIDPARIAIAGFSDGASYALGVGITNGDLFTHVIAFSPGFIAPVAQRGEPRLFISHGKWDKVLPIDRCSHKIVPQMQQAGYDVVYHEFDGFHVVPDLISRAVVTWFTAKQE